MTLYLIILMGLTGQVGYNGSRVAVSLYALDLGANQLEIGILVALYAVFPMLLAVLVGRFIDRVGSRPPVILGIVGLTAALVLPPLFPGLTMLYVSCTLLGLAHLFFVMPLEACVGGLGGPDKRASNYAMLSMGWAIANSFGPMVSGFSIDHIGHVHAFWVLAGFSVLPMFLLWLRPGLLPNAPARAATQKRGSVLELWRIPGLRTIFIIGAVINSAQNLFQFYFPIYGHALGFSASVIGSILGSVSVAAFMIRSILPRMLKRWAEAKVLAGAVFVAAFAFALLPFVKNPYALAVIAFVLGLGTGCGNPLQMSLLYLLTPRGRNAESVGLLRTAYNVSQLTVPIVFGMVGSAFGFSTVFLTNAVMLTAGGLLMRNTRITPADSAPK